MNNGATPHLSAATVDLGSLPSSLVHVSVCPHVLSFAVAVVLHPVAFIYIPLPLAIAPYDASLAVLLSLVPLTFVSTCLAIFSPLFVRTRKRTAPFPDLCSTPVLLIVLPVALVTIHINFGKIAISVPTAICRQITAVSTGGVLLDLDRPRRSRFVQALLVRELMDQVKPLPGAISRRLLSVGSA